MTEDGVFWMFINSSKYWRVNLYRASIGNVYIEFYGEIDVLLNSGTSYIHIPNRSYSKIIDVILRGKECYLDEDINLWVCKECSGADDPSYPTFKVLIGSRIH